MGDLGTMRPNGVYEQGAVVGKVGETEYWAVI